MSRLMTGSGKFVSAVSEYDSAQQDIKAVYLGVKPAMTGDETPIDEIPSVPENPDVRPKFIRIAEEYFGRYWIVTLVLLIIVLFRKK